MTTPVAEAPAARLGPSLDSEITWLLHRAAQRMHAATGEQAEAHGLHLRDHIVLSALHLRPGLTQVELAKEVGLDKTTLMTQLDRLERSGLVVRRPDPRDRRARLPQITEAGEALREKVAHACAEVEARTLKTFSPGQVATFRRMLVHVIGDGTDRGSCL
ncbi:MAG: MarR family winged helix-turn-helix transcriptional regulator [Janthinobacterium lividum]